MGRFKILLRTLALLLAINLLFCSCKHKAHQLEFISLPQFNSGDTSLFKGKDHISKSFYVIVKGYHNKEYDRKKIDSFAFAFKKQNIEVNSCNLTFLKYSDATNPQNLKKNPKDFYRDSPDDVLFDYSWEDEILISKAVYDGDKRID